MKFVLVAILSLPLITFGQKTPGAGFEITGSVTALPDQSKVSVTDINNPTDTLARAVMSKGAFVLKGVMKEPNLVQLNFDGAQKKSVLFIGNEKIAVSGDASNIQELTVKGSPIHNDFMSFQQIFNPLFKRLSELN